MSETIRMPISVASREVITEVFKREGIPVEAHDDRGNRIEAQLLPPSKETEE